MSRIVFMLILLSFGCSPETDPSTTPPPVEAEPTISLEQSVEPSMGAEPSEPSPQNLAPREPTGPRPAAAEAEVELIPWPPHENGVHQVPVDCPLAKAGYDPNALRPFEDVDKYIAFLEREDRAAWQKPDAVVAALGLAKDDVVVDLGAGSGYFAFRFANAVPDGQVEALDVEAEMVRHIHHKTMTEGIENLDAGFVDPRQPTYRDDATVVFVCDVLHHVDEQQEWLNQVAAELPPEARLVLIEFREGDIPEGPPEGMKIARENLIEMANTAGLTLTRDQSEVLPYQVMLTFRRE